MPEAGALAGSRVAEAVVMTLDEGWSVRFPEGSGAPAEVRLEKLGPWSAHAEEGVKYFSGTATYTKRITVPAEALRAGTGVFLDLGRVGDIAEVFVNGKAMGLSWHAPHDMSQSDPPADFCTMAAIAACWLCC